MKIILQQWEGIIEDIDDREFISKLIDITNGGTDEEITIKISDIPEAQQHLIVPNRIFYLDVGYFKGEKQFMELKFKGSEKIINLPKK